MSEDSKKQESIKSSRLLNSIVEYVIQSKISEKDTDLEHLSELAPETERDAFLEELKSAAQENSEKQSNPLPIELPDRYTVVRKLGNGSCAEVYQCYDANLGKELAIKIPNAKSFQSYLASKTIHREAKSISRLSHPNIIRSYDIGKTDDGQFYISMELAERGTSRQFCSEHDLDAACFVVLGVCKGLQHAHDQGILHRDIKPSNILIDKDLTPKLGDFGIARDSEATTASDAGIKGSLPYMSPEQSLDDEIDNRSDIYSLGLTLYELLTGVRPFERNDAKGTLAAIQSFTPKSPRQVKPTVPTTLSDICMKAICKLPEDRYQTAEELGQELERYLGGEDFKVARVVKQKNVAKLAGATALVATLILLSFVGYSFLGSPAKSNDKRKLDHLSVSDNKNARYMILTEPPGANVYLVPFDKNPALPTVVESIDLGKSPVVFEAPPGEYFVVAVGDDGSFHEVIRYLPTDTERSLDFRHHHWETNDNGLIELSTIKLWRHSTLAGMRKSGNVLLPATQVMDREYYSQPEFNGLSPDVSDKPITLLNFDEALSFAERYGFRLPFLTELTGVQDENQEWTLSRPNMTAVVPSPWQARFVYHESNNAPAATIHVDRQPNLAFRCCRSVRPLVGHDKSNSE